MMTSVVNGEAFDKSTVKDATKDDNQSTAANDNKSSANKNDLEANKTCDVEKDKSKDLENNTDLQNDKLCVDLTIETDEETKTVTNEKISKNKLIKSPEKNGTTCTSSDHEKEPFPGIKDKNSSDEKNLSSPSELNAQGNKTLNCEDPKDNEAENRSIRLTHEQENHSLKNKANDERENGILKGKSEKDSKSLSKKLSENISEVSAVTEETIDSSKETSILSSINDKNLDESSKCGNEKDEPVFVGEYETEKSTGSHLNGSLDLSVPKNKDSSSSHQHVSAESHPLEKLNEHLNSIGRDESSRSVQNMSPKVSSFKSIAPKADNLSSNKENKNIAPHAHDRFRESPDNFVFAELSNEETGFPEVFTGLVKIGRYISVKGDFTLKSSEALVESPSIVSSYLLKQPDSFPPKEKDSKSEPHDFFHSTAGEILIGIGLSRVNEWFHKDMVRVKKRQMKREGKRPQLEEELAAHERNYAEAKKANSVYSYAHKACKTCGFTTESLIVMEGHLLTPHLTQRREYQCNFCNVIDRDPKIMLEHMKEEHKKIGSIQPPVLFFECPYCTFESNSKVKLSNHLAKCQRYFDHGVNQAPPRDFEFPALTPKPITVAVVKAYEKSLGSMQRGRGRPKKSEQMAALQMNQISQVYPPTSNNLTNYKPITSSPLIDSYGIQNQMMSPMQMSNFNIRPAHSNSPSIIRPNIPPLQLEGSNRIYQVINPTGQAVTVVGNNAGPFSFSPSLVNNSGKKIHSSGPPYFNPPLTVGLHQQNMTKNMPETSTLPKLTGPYPAPISKQANQPNVTSTPNSLVVCEICDGYIKDLDQLRTHMQLIHKVKIHPKMLVSRPPLNCQKCQWRFFTDQGLERHLLGSHGLVTSNMQELANKNKDAGCCTICGRVYATKLVNHMNQIHKITLKPAHLSYKCTVCSATFNLYRLFENHVYLVHSGAAKRSSEGGRSSPTKKLRAVSDKVDSTLEQNHKEKKQPADLEEVRICVECGDDVLSSKPDCKKCEKCLKSDELVQGTLNTKTVKDELKRREKTKGKVA